MGTQTISQAATEDEATIQEVAEELTRVENLGNCEIVLTAEGKIRVRLSGLSESVGDGSIILDERASDTIGGYLYEVDEDFSRESAYRAAAIDLLTNLANA